MWSVTAAISYILLYRLVFLAKPADLKIDTGAMVMIGVISLMPLANLLITLAAYTLVQVMGEDWLNDMTCSEADPDTEKDE